MRRFSRPQRTFWGFLPAFRVLKWNAYAANKLHRDFWKDIHAADLGGHSELRPFLHPHHCCLTANPTLLSGSEFGRKNQNELDLRSLLHARVRIEENTIRAHIPRLRGFVAALRGAYTRRNPRRHARPRPALAVRLHRQNKGATTVHQDRECNEKIGARGAQSYVRRESQIRSPVAGRALRAPPPPAPLSARSSLAASLQSRAAYRSAKSGSRPAPADPW